MAPVVTPKDKAATIMAPNAPSEKYGAQFTTVSGELGLGGLGCMLVEVEPGKRAFPFHNHLGKDEMFIILEGEGTYRFGADAYPVKAGDICSAPRGGPDKAHQIINTGSTTLRYYGISTMEDPDIVEYPDSGKFAAMAVAPGPHFMQAHLRFVGRRADGVDYWDGEEL